MTGINQDLSAVPSSAKFNSHYHCDYIELLALVNNGDIVSTSDVYNRYMGSELGVDDSNSDKDMQGTLDNADISDSWEQQLHDWFLILNSRSDSYGIAYPFQVIDINKIFLKPDLNENNYMYIFLLLSSLLKYFDGPTKSKLTTDFEEVSFLALKKYLPDFAESHKFGKSTIANERYTGNIKSKIDMLAKDLKRKTCYESYFFSDNNNGDLGIDLVAWLPISNDENYNFIQIMFAQCGAGKDWLSKQHEAIMQVKNCIAKVHQPINIMFIPYDARNADRTFNEEVKIDEAIYLFDRHRILTLLNGAASKVTELLTYKDTVLGVTDYQEDLV